VGTLVFQHILISVALGWRKAAEGCAHLCKGTSFYIACSGAMTANPSRLGLSDAYVAGAKRIGSQPKLSRYVPGPIGLSPEFGVLPACCKVPKIGLHSDPEADAQAFVGRALTKANNFGSLILESVNGKSRALSVDCLSETELKFRKPHNLV
jgi:hypothetical protein